MDDIERKIQGTINILRYVNPYLAEFLKWTRPPSISRTTHYQFLEYQDVNLKVCKTTVCGAKDFVPSIVGT